jgi:hypothetical protein
MSPGGERKGKLAPICAPTKARNSDGKTPASLCKPVTSIIKIAKEIPKLKE